MKINVINFISRYFLIILILLFTFKLSSSFLIFEFYSNIFGNCMKVVMLDLKKLGKNI